MAAVPVHSDFGAQGGKSLFLVCPYLFSPSIFYEGMGPDAMILFIYFFNVEF